MLKRILSGAGALAALGALALGSSAFASAQTSQVAAGHTAKAQVHRTVVRRAAETTTAADTDNVQSGDQNSPDGTASQTEAGGESAAPSDGPGGHQDPAGANVDHQFQGQE